MEYVFGTCGHTNIALLDALSRSRIRFVIARHEQAAAHAADGYARMSGQPGVLLLHVGPGHDERGHRRGHGRARLHPAGGHQRRRALLLRGPASAPGSQPARRRRPDRDLPAVHQAGLARAPGRGPARFTERAFWTATSGRPGAVLLNVPMDIFSRPVPAERSRLPAARGHRAARPARRRGGPHRRAAGQRRAAADLHRRRAARPGRAAGAARPGRAPGHPGRALADGQGHRAGQTIRCCSA